MIDFGTKAETLQRICAYNSTFEVPPFEYCVYRDWRDDCASIAKRLAERFDGVPVAVRSSALVEDRHASSMAGAFESLLGIKATQQTLADAIDRVFASYGAAPDPLDQVLVQTMVGDVAISGVAMTHNLQDGAPYYVISYDDFSGRTDTVTSGHYPHKTIVIHRSCPDVAVKSPRLRMVLRLVRDVESIMGLQPMDIEFALDRRGRAYLLQVRPMATEQQWKRHIDTDINNEIRTARKHLDRLKTVAPGLVGRRTVYANMPDWNPAEMIHAVPRPMAASLYRSLITHSVWSAARKWMGYHPVEGVDLMRLVAGHAFVDVRASLVSLLPPGLEADVAGAFVDASIVRLIAEPTLHDKLEFELSINASTPSLEQDFKRVFPMVPEDFKEAFGNSLVALTDRLVSVHPESTLVMAQRRISALAQNQQRRSLNVSDWVLPEMASAQLTFLAAECTRLGTLPFAVLARHAFISQSFLRAFVSQGLLSEERCEELKSSVATIATEMSVRMRQVAAGQESVESFMALYGHLRPGTYDIASPRYFDRKDLFTEGVSIDGLNPCREFNWTEEEKRRIDQALISSGISRVNSDGFLRYVRTAIQGREWAKLVFSRNLSDMLEIAAMWGERQGLSRDDMSYVDINSLLDESYSQEAEHRPSVFEYLLQRNREAWSIASSVCLPHMLVEPDDLVVIPLQRSMPNFVTRLSVEADLVVLENTSRGDERVSGHVVCIQSADPGFDWIFSRDIAGLITQHGGPNSHMAIRCSEFGLPAAIGVGDELYQRITKSRGLYLDCGRKLIEVRD